MGMINVGKFSCQTRFYKDDLVFSIAEYQDVQPLVEVINTAYRGETSKLGWTSEADLLDGRRTDTQHIKKLLCADDSMILLCKAGGELLGCLHLQRQGIEAQISMFAVKPMVQDRGIGKQLLSLAEIEAQRLWMVKRLVMSVILGRQELLAFYLRRGYKRTGETKAFPVNPALWTPKIHGLQLESLEKIL